MKGFLKGVGRLGFMLVPLILATLMADHILKHGSREVGAAGGTAKELKMKNKSGGD